MPPGSKPPTLPAITMDSLRLFNSIKDTVFSIDKDLNQTNNTGIYFAPELYISFCIGKDILKRQEEIFNTTNVEWLREINLGNGGPTDIIFKVDNKYSIIELKIRDNIHSYKSDVDKLKRLKLNANKFFCVLVDTFTDTTDKRLINLENDYGNNIVKVGGVSFQTWNNLYKKNVFCILNLYSIV